jgi:hypothetical protein
LYTIRHSAYYASATHAVKTWSTWLTPEHPVVAKWMDKSTRSSQLLEDARQRQVLLCQEHNTTAIKPVGKYSKNGEGDKADPEAFLVPVSQPAIPQGLQSIPQMHQPAVDGTQRLLSKMHDKIMFRAIWNSIKPQDVPRRTQFLANTVPTSNLWLRNVPNNPRFKLDPFCFRFNLLQHFCLDDNINALLGVNTSMSCVCSQDITSHPANAKLTVRPAGYAHFVNCTRQSAFTTRHNLIVKVCADAIRAAGLHPQLEIMASKASMAPTGTGNLPSNQKRFDVTVGGADDLLTMHLDVSVTSSRQLDQALAQGSSRFPLHTANNKVKHKINVYKDSIYPDVETLLPMVAETSGAMHPNFAKFFNTIGARVDNRPPLDAAWTTPTFATYWLALTSVTLRRETARACQKLALATLARTGISGTGHSDTESEAQDS